jgi:hypothetical protein
MSLDLPAFRAQLEEEITWRVEEVVFFQNQCERLSSEDQKEQFRRALVLLLYSNFEGYCKFALSLYVTAVNSEGIQCKDADYSIVAATLSDVFSALRDGGKKVQEFKNDAPDDSKLHRFARDREFVRRAVEIMAKKVAIPDSAVDTESNLNPVVLRKNLYRLGLPHDQFAFMDGDINKLLHLRNKIAHGESKLGVPEKLYGQLRDAAFRVMNGISSGITQACSEKRYLLGASPPAGQQVAE